MQALNVGDPIPDFELESDDGGTVSSASLAGRPYVLYFYPKDDTSGCTTEAKDFSALHSRFEALGIPVVGVSPDPIEKHRKFRQKHDLSVTLLSDGANDLTGRLGLWVEKSMYGKRYHGVERTTFLVGPDGRILRAWRKVKVAGHAEEVLVAAEAATT